MVSLQPATLLAAVAPGEYQLDPGRTSIDIKMKTNWGLQTVRATFRIDHGGFRVDGGGRLSSVSAVIDAASFFSRNSRRDRHVKSADFLDVERYPTISFAADESRPTDEGLVLSGIVTIHGVSEPADVQIDEAVMEGGVAKFEASAALDRRTFGITHMPRRIRNNVLLAIHAAALSQS